METIVFVRHNIDWADMTMKEFMSQNPRFGPGGRETEGKAILKWFKANKIFFDLWNQIFQIDYFTFRARVKELAEETFVGVKVVKGFEALKQECKKNEEDAYIVPIDDDDWISPKLASRLSSQSAAIIHWNMAFTDNPRTKYGFKSFRTCNFAVRKSIIQNTPKFQKLLLHHVSFGNHAKRIKSARIRALLSVANRTIASVGQMQRIWQRSVSRKRFQSRLSEMALVMSRIKKTGIEWTIPFMEKNAELHRRLLQPTWLM